MDSVECVANFHFCAAMASSEMSIESQVILKHRLMIVDRIPKSVSVLWLTQKLQQEDFISSERAADIRNMLGISDCDKVSQMMEAVESKIKYKPSRFFRKFVAIVESEPALEDVCRALNECYQEKLSKYKCCRIRNVFKSFVHAHEKAKTPNPPG